MTRYYCDKCGKELEPNRRNVLLYRFNSIGKITNYQSGLRKLDICDECLGELEKLGKDYPSGPNDFDTEDTDDYE